MEHSSIKQRVDGKPMNSFPMHCTPPPKSTHYSSCDCTDDEDDNDDCGNRNDDDDDDKKGDVWNQCQYQQQKNLDSGKYFDVAMSYI